MGSLDPIRIRIRNPNTDPDPGVQKWPTKKKLIHFFWSAGCSLLRAECFSCSLDVLYGSLEISKLQFLIKKRFKKFSAVFFCLQCLVIKPWIRIGSRSGFTWNVGSWSVSGSRGYESGFTTLLCWNRSRKQEGIQRFLTAVPMRIHLPPLPAK